MRGTDAAGWVLVLLIAVPLLVASVCCIFGVVQLIISLL